LLEGANTKHAAKMSHKLLHHRGRLRSKAAFLLPLHNKSTVTKWESLKMNNQMMDEEIIIIFIFNFFPMYYEANFFGKNT
jgi:hypothetical protein